MSETDPAGRERELFVDPIHVKKRPVVVEARRAREAGTCDTAHGPIPYEEGDWIITDPRNGDTWPVKARFFDENYEVVND